MKRGVDGGVRPSQLGMQPPIRRSYFSTTLGDRPSIGSVAPCRRRRAVVSVAAILQQGRGQRYAESSEGESAGPSSGKGQGVLGFAYTEHLKPTCMLFSEVLHKVSSFDVPRWPLALGEVDQTRALGARDV